MSKFMKKPIVVSAWQIGSLLKSAEYAWDQLPKEVADAYEQGVFVFTREILRIKTLEGEMIGSPSDYLIQGVNGEFYPCREDIFHKSYDPAATSKDTEMGREKK